MYNYRTKVSWMKNSAIRNFFFCGITVLLVSCGGPKTITDESVQRRNSVVARADNGYSILLSDYYTHLKRSSYLSKGGIFDAESAERFRDSLVMDTLMGFESKEVNLRDYPPFYISFRERYTLFLHEQFWKQTVYQKVHADSLEIFEFYSTRPDLFALPDYVYVKQIFVNIDGLRNGKDSLKYRKQSLDELNRSAKNLIFDIRRKIDSGLQFDEAAKSYSMDVLTGRTGGHLGWIPKGRYLHPFDSVAFGLRNNEISQPYLDKDGWHILHVERRVEEGVQPYDSMWYRVAGENLLQLKTNNLADTIKDTLYKSYEVRMNPAILDTNIFLVEDTLWCSIVNDRDTILAYEMKRTEDTWRRAKKLTNTDAATKKVIAEEIAKRYLVISSARAIGIDTQFVTRTGKAALEHETAKSIVQSLQRATNLIPSDSEIDAYYQSHLKEFVPEKPLTVQQIIAPDSLQAEFIRDQALSGVDFMELARKYYPGEESLREELANLGEVGAKDVDSAFFKQALLTPAGSVSHPVQTKYGWHVIKVLKRVDALPVGNARYKIMGLLEQQAKDKFAADYQAKLFKKYNVKFPTRLAPVHLAPYSDRLKTIN
jgi:parvulin-like peptidyl-prolyl isomerase